MRYTEWVNDEQVEREATPEEEAAHLAEQAIAQAEWDAKTAQEEAAEAQRAADLETIRTGSPMDQSWRDAFARVNSAAT